MRIRFQDILFAFLLSVVTPAGFILAQAQDTSFPGTEVDALGVDKESDKMYNPGELDPAFQKAQTTTFKDSLGIRPNIRGYKSPGRRKQNACKTTITGR